MSCTSAGVTPFNSCPSAPMITGASIVSVPIPRYEQGPTQTAAFSCFGQVHRHYTRTASLAPAGAVLALVQVRQILQSMLLGCASV